MLSVESLAGHGAFWRNRIPFESNYLKFKQREAVLIERFESVKSPEWDLVAEYAFITATCRYSESKALNQAIEKIEMLREKTGAMRNECSISPPAKDVAEALGMQIRDDLALHFKLEEIVWQPVVPGFGGLLPSEADALANSCIIEVKNVDRAFHARDIRQVLLYATALNGSGVDVDTFCLLNSRKGLLLKSSLHDACRAMGGISWISVRSEIEDLLTSLNSWFVLDR